MEALTLFLIQTPLAWEDPATNRDVFSQYINEIEGTGIIILPEMFATGFTMNPEAVAESMDGESVNWMKQMASLKNCAITGSLVIEENGKYYNRMLFVLPDGTIQTYDKRHLFTMAGEDKHYTQGKEKLIVNYNGYALCLLVCFDLRFPVFSRNTENYDVLVYVANWPEQRSTAWNALLKARAIENVCYTVGVNRNGTDGNGHAYTGDTQVIDALGEYVLAPQKGEGVFTVQLSKEHLLQTREKFDFLKERDSFKLL